MKSLDRTWLLCAAAAALIILSADLARGDVINLPAGPVSAMEFKAGNTYVGTPGKTVINAASKSSPLKVTGSNVILKNFAINGGGIRRDGNFAGLTIDNVEIRNAHVALEVNGGSDVSLRNSLLEKCDYASWINDMSNLAIESNEVREVSYGVKCFGDSPNNRNRAWRKNWVHDCGPDFMAMELQGAGDGFAIEDNVVERIRFGPNKVDNDHSLIVSAPMDKWRNGQITGNVIIGQKPRDAGDPGSWMNGHPLLLEAGGENVLIENNLLDGGGTGISVTDQAGGCSVTLKNNKIVNTYRTWNKSAGQSVTLIGTNDASTVLPFTVEQKRAAAGRHAADAPTPAPTPTPAPAPTTDPAIADLAGRVDEMQKRIDGLEARFTAVSEAAKSK